MYNSTETCGTVTATAIGTPSSVLSKRSYQLRVSPVSERKKSFVQTPQEQGLSPSFGSASRLSVNHFNSKEKQRHRVRRSQTENLGDLKKATLTKQRINSKFAPIRKNRTSENMLAIPENNVTNQDPCRGFTTNNEHAKNSVLNSVSQRTEECSATSCENANLSTAIRALDLTSSSNCQHTEKRPKFLSISSINLPAKEGSPRSPFSRKHNLSLPNLKS